MRKLSRIYILGPPGSGKTFLANKLSGSLKIPHYDMDDVRFIKKFTKARTKPQRKKKVDIILQKKKWIIDARGTDWDRHAMLNANLIVWLRTSFPKRGSRITKRYFTRNKNQNIEEKFLDQFSLIKYSLSHRFSKRATGLKSTKEFLEKHNLNPVVIKNQKQLKDLLEKLT